MVAHYARKSYLQAKVRVETDPKRLILMLYEGALEDIRLAREGIVQQDARKRGERLSRAVAIVSTLLDSLNSDVDVTDESMGFLRGLYQAMLVELSKVAVTHDVNTLDLAFRYLERLKHIWEHDVMGLPSYAPEEQPQGSQHVAVSAAAPPVVVPRSAYGRPAPAVGQRTVPV